MCDVKHEVLNDKFVHCSRGVIVLHNCSDGSVVPSTSCSSSNGKPSAGQSRSEQLLRESLVF